MTVYHITENQFNQHTSSQLLKQNQPYYNILNCLNIDHLYPRPLAVYASIKSDDSTLPKNEIFRYSELFIFIWKSCNKLVSNFPHGNLICTYYTKSYMSDDEAKQIRFY